MSPVRIRQDPEFDVDDNNDDFSIQSPESDYTPPFYIHATGVPLLLFEDTEITSTEAARGCFLDATIDPMDQDDGLPVKGTDPIFEFELLSDVTPGDPNHPLEAIRYPADDYVQNIQQSPDISSAILPNPESRIQYKDTENNSCMRDHITMEVISEGPNTEAIMENMLRVVTTEPVQNANGSTCNHDKQSKVLDEKGSQLLHRAANKMIERYRRMQKARSRKEREIAKIQFYKFGEDAMAERVCAYVFLMLTFYDNGSWGADEIREYLYKTYKVECREEYSSPNSLTSAATQFSHEAVHIVTAPFIEICMMIIRNGFGTMGWDRERCMENSCPEMIARQPFYTCPGGPKSVLWMMQKVRQMSAADVRRRQVAPGAKEPANLRSARRLKDARQLSYKRLQTLWSIIWDDCTKVCEMLCSESPSKELSPDGLSWMTPSG